LIGIGTLFLILTWETSKKRRDDIPASPDPSIIWGHALKLLEYHDKRHDWMLIQARNVIDRGLGMTFHAHIPFAPTLIITVDPKNVEHVLKTNFDNYIKGPYFHEIQLELLGNGIFNTDGESWKIQRKVASHLFSVRNFRDFMLGVFESHLCSLLNILKLSQSKERTVDMHDLLHRFTLDSFMEIGFGTTVNTLEAEHQLPFAVAFDKAQEIVSNRFVMGREQRIVAEWWNGNRLTLKKCMKITDDFARTIIQQRRNDADLKEKKDLLSRFLNLESETYSDKELRDIVMNLYVDLEFRRAISISHFPKTEDFSMGLFTSRYL
jgi:cytochrome P450